MHASPGATAKQPMTLEAERAMLEGEQLDNLRIGLQGQLNEVDEAIHHTEHALRAMLVRREVLSAALARYFEATDDQAEDGAEREPDVPEAMSQQTMASGSRLQDRVGRSQLFDRPVR